MKVWHIILAFSWGGLAIYTIITKDISWIMGAIALGTLAITNLIEALS